MLVVQMEMRWSNMSGEKTFTKTYKTRTLESNAHFDIHPATKEMLRPDPDTENAIQAEITKRLEALEAEVRQNAFNEGYSKGHQEGLDKAYTEAQEVANEKLARLELWVGSVESYKESILKSQDVWILKSFLEIAQKICRKALAQDPEFLKRAILEGLQKLDPTEYIRIRVNPKDLENLSHFKSEILSKYGSIKSFQWINDESIEASSIEIEVEDAAMLSGVKAQIERLGEEWLAQL